MGKNYTYKQEEFLQWTWSSTNTDHSGAESEQMATFNLLCGNTDDELAAKASFGEIKMWFLTQYPEIEKARQNIDEIIAKAKEARIAAKAA